MQAPLQTGGATTSAALAARRPPTPPQPRSRCLGCRRRLTVTMQASSSNIQASTNSRQASSSSQQPPPIHLLPRQAVVMFAAGAALGPWCDGLHSQHDVLHYVSPSIRLQLDRGPLHWSFESCWWVPLLFGVAGLILGVAVPLLDDAVADSSSGGRMGLGRASWGWVLLCISAFVTQYWLSGVLEGPLVGHTLLGPVLPTLDAVLAATALAIWVAFDGSGPGAAMAALTAVCGPALEVALVNGLGLYHYSHPTVFGAVPSWIPWVYAAGGPAVGNLGRLVWATLKRQQQLPAE